MFRTEIEQKKKLLKIKSSILFTASRSMEVISDFWSLLLPVGAVNLILILFRVTISQTASTCMIARVGSINVPHFQSFCFHITPILIGYRSQQWHSAQDT
uniref:Uncharacterized protein n=1 Tax=Arundo donax TaxID=35708 RepID=A0A0A9GQI2_ARUDO